MPSPFPGMDPYLEDSAFWPDFHASFITYWRDALMEKLPDNYEARIDEHVRVVELTGEPVKGMLPDLSVSQLATSWPLSSAGGAVMTLEPVTLPIAFPVEIRERHIELLHRPDRALVAMLELLSPTNKADEGRSDNLAKRRAILGQPVHLVELDLLIAGKRLPTARPLPAGDYYAFVARSERRPNCEVYSWRLDDPLPTIPIPLRTPDPDIILDLGAILATAYQKGRYARVLPYEGPPSAPLGDNQLAWIEDRMKAMRQVQ